MPEIHSQYMKRILAAIFLFTIEGDEVNMKCINIMYLNLTLEVAPLQSDTPNFLYFFSFTHPNTLALAF